MAKWTKIIKKNMALDWWTIYNGYSWIIGRIY